MSSASQPVQRGRGTRNRGRGRGRGFPNSNANDWDSRNRGIAHSREQSALSSTAVITEAGSSGSLVVETEAHKTFTKKAKLSHFLCLPLGTHGSLRTIASQFTSSLLSCEPPIPGLDESIVIAPRRLHFTLGVMSLNSNPHEIFDPIENGKSLPSLSSAIELLHSLRPRVLSMLEDKQLLVPLEEMDIMRPDRGDPEKAHVLWVGPHVAYRGKSTSAVESSHVNETHVNKLVQVSTFLQREFMNAGFMIDEKRPLKLHCTLINTIYRKPRPRNNSRIPFSFPSIIRSDSFKSMSVDSNPLDVLKTNASSQQDSKPKVRGPFRIEMGTYPIEEIQICEMGSHGPEGEYVSAGQISLS